MVITIYQDTFDALMEMTLKNMSSYCLGHDALIVLISLGQTPEDISKRTYRIVNGKLEGLLNISSYSDQNLHGMIQHIRQRIDYDSVVCGLGHSLLSINKLIESQLFFYHCLSENVLTIDQCVDLHRHQSKIGAKRYTFQFEPSFLYKWKSPGKGRKLSWLRRDNLEKIVTVLAADDMTPTPKLLRELGYNSRDIKYAHDIVDANCSFFPYHVID